MEGEGVERTYLDMLGDVLSTLLETYASEHVKKENWNLEGLNTALQQQFGLRIEFQSFPSITAEILNDSVGKSVKDLFDRQKANLGNFYGQIQKMILLQAIDHHWKEHLGRIDRLKEGINLRGYAQKDPLIEYKKEAYGAFEQLNMVIKTDALEKLMKVQIVSPDQAQRMQDMMQAPALDELDYHGADEAAAGGGNIPSPAPGQVPALPPTTPTNGVEEEAAQPQRMRMRAGPPAADNDRPQNRESRRRTEKTKRR